jgi:hypothetical protein
MSSWLSATSAIATEGKVNGAFSIGPYNRGGEGRGSRYPRAVRPDVHEHAYHGEVLEALQREGLRGRMKVMLGGASVTDEFAKRVGADAASNEALSGIRTMEKWMK